MGEHWRPVWAEIDLDALRHNARVLRRRAYPAALCAVVKADGYGHGAVAVAEAAVEAGASWLAVARVEEGVVLREGGVEVPVLLLSEPPQEAMVEVVASGLTPTVYTATGIEALGRAAASLGVPHVDAHLKVDTGMHRVGADSTDVMSLAAAIDAHPHLRLGALWTHMAVAEGVSSEDRAFTDLQVGRFEAAVATLSGAGLVPMTTHMANSAATIAVPETRRALVRCGIALYGVAPTPALGVAVATAAEPLRPVLSLRARVSFVRDLDAGARPSYGRRRPLAERSTVATVPVGYADGVPRRLFDCNGAVLLGGRRRPLAGSVTMDQTVVDCGPVGDATVSVGDEVVLIGRQGDEEITVDEWAGWLGTIGYEVLCGIGARVPRVSLGHSPPKGTALPSGRGNGP